MSLAIHDWGCIPYRDAWARQDALRDARSRGEISDTFIICEHPPVFTIGRQDCRDDWKSTFDAIARAGIDVVHVNRGGRITYHGPGQIIGYFIVDIAARKLAVRALVTAVEEILIRTLADFTLTAARDQAHPGVWIANEKIAALGLHISRGITQHGFALNHQPKLEDYHHITPCGIADRKITSMTTLLGDRIPTRAQVIQKILHHTQAIFA